MAAIRRVEMAAAAEALGVQHREVVDQTGPVEGLGLGEGGLRLLVRFAKMLAVFQTVAVGDQGGFHLVEGAVDLVDRAAAGRRIAAGLMLDAVVCGWLAGCADVRQATGKGINE